MRHQCRGYRYESVSASTRCAAFVAEDPRCPRTADRIKRVRLLRRRFLTLLLVALTATILVRGLRANRSWWSAQTSGLDTNLRGAFYCVRAAVPLLRKQEGSAIVNIASVAGMTGLGSSMAYAASKGAMITLTKSLARALAPAIRVNAIAPGFVRTRFADWPQSAFDEGEAMTPLKRLATVEEIAALAWHLAVDAKSITGETIAVDGGVAELGAIRTNVSR